MMGLTRIEVINEIQLTEYNTRGAGSSSPLIIKASTMKTHDSANKYEEREELNQHGSCPNQICVPEDNWNGYAAY